MTEQNGLTVQTAIFTPKTCAFTGHRDLGEDFSFKCLQTAVENCIKQGITTFYNGLAMGLDMLACEVVIALKEKYPAVRLVGCIPCTNQTAFFPKPELERYEKIVAQLDETVYVHGGNYYRGCMQKRNRYMCDLADVLIAYCKKTTGGTAYTVQYFQKNYPQKQVLFL